MIIPIDAQGRVDDTVKRFAQIVQTKYPILIVTRFENYRFNTELLSMGKYILFDFSEYGANDWNRKETHIWSKNTDKFKYAFPGPEWDKFDEFVAKNPPIITFKRELLKKDASENIVPIEYICWGERYQTQTKKEFIERPIEVFNYWGWSHESRRVLHGRIWEHAAKKGIYVIDNLNYLKGALSDADNKRLWITANIPHYARIDMSYIYAVMGNCKLTLSLPGAGIKCFRAAEAPTNSLMVMQEDPLSWSFPWVDGENCIKVKIGNTMADISGTSGNCPEIPAIEEALQRTDLHRIYLEGVHNVENYRPDKYIPFIEKQINAAARL